MRQSDPGGQLFTAFAEELKMPLLQIARLSEQDRTGLLEHINLISGQALKLVDAYLWSQQQMELPLEPLNTASVLYDVAQAIHPSAKQLGYEIAIDSIGKAQPVMGHRETLTTMLTLLGTSLIGAHTEPEESVRQITLATHRSSHGTVVGAFTNNSSLTRQTLQFVRQLHGQAQQAAPALSASGGAQLAIADRLSERLHAPLKSYRHHHLTGIGSLLAPSKQLQLV